MRGLRGQTGEVGAYSSDEAASLVAIIVFAIISILAVGYFLAFCLRHSMRAFLSKRQGEGGQNIKRSFFQTQLGAYTVSLLLSNFLMSIGFIISAHWIALGGVHMGALCTGQGLVIQVSMTATAYFTSAIAVHAFTTLACRRRLPDWLCGAAVLSGWAIAVVMGIIPFMINDGRLYGFNGLICSISRAYPALQFFFQLIPVFLAMFTSILFYSLIHLVLRGAISTTDGLKINLTSEGRKRSLDMSGNDPRYQQFILTVATSLFLYPIAFILLALPVAAIGLMEVTGSDVHFGEHVFANCAIAALGLANAAILLNTLRIMAPFASICVFAGTPATTDSESFFAPSSSPVGSPGKTSLDGDWLSVSVGSSFKFETADGFLTVLPVAHVSPKRAAQLDRTSSLTTLRSPDERRNSQHQNEIRSSTRLSFPMQTIRTPAPAHTHNSQTESQKAPVSPVPSSPTASALASLIPVRRKPPPLEEPLRSSTVPVVTVIPPTTVEAARSSPKARIVSPNVRRNVTHTPPDSATTVESRSASFIDPQSAGVQSQSAGVQSQSAGVQLALLRAKLFEAQANLVPRSSLPSSPQRPAVMRTSIAPNSRAPSVASSATTFRGLPSDPRAMRAAWEEIGSQSMRIRTPSRLSGVGESAATGPTTSSHNRATISTSSPSQPSVPIRSAPGSRAEMRGKPRGQRPIPRTQSNIDLRSARWQHAAGVVPRVVSASGPLAAAETFATRTPSGTSAPLTSPSMASVAGVGDVPLLAGRRRTTIRLSKPVSLSPSGYI